MWLILGKVFTLHSYVPASRASVALITNVQSSARIRGLKVIILLLEVYGPYGPDF